METTQALRARLSERGRDLLDGKVSNRSTLSTWNAIAREVYAAGLDFDDYNALGSNCDAYVGSREMYKLMLDTWTFVEDNWREPLGSQADVRHRLAELSRYAAEGRRWPGRTGTTDRAVALAVLGRFHEVGAYTLGIDCRTVAERSGLGIGHGTANRSMWRLAKLGLLRPVGRDGWEAARRWKVNLAWEAQNWDSRSYPGIGSTVPVSTVHEHPAFTRGALGATAGRVWVALPDDTTLTVAEAATAAGVSGGSARYNLRKLVDAGLAEQRDPLPGKRGMRFSVVPVDHGYLDVLAKEHGTEDVFERQAERHARERAEYVLRRAERIADREREQQRERDSRASAVDPFSDDSEPYTAGPMPTTGGPPDPFLDAA